MFDTVLVANRGEIAVRVIRTLRRLGIRSVAVYSDPDVDARHVLEADAAVRLGPAPARESYLDIGKVLDAAARTGAQAIHPGYGFLAENADFAAACERARVVFLGPPARAIEVMGDKIAAKNAVAAFDVPVVPGVARAGLTDDALVTAAAEVGYPVLIKPSAGGGGKGMRLVQDPARLPEALVSARREAMSSFGDDTLFLERFVLRPRHIEVQVLADAHGNVVHLGERECSLQRRHQKVIEEAPSPLLDPQTRERIGVAACNTARCVDYVGAGTVEFIVSAQRPDEFFFMEMNTRLQVEHPVTEAITGLDLVEWQLRVGAGEKLGFAQNDIELRGHAIEARVYAEDPAREFLPTGGRVLAVFEPAGPGVRVDSSLLGGTVVGSDYDPLLTKVIAHGADREEALDRLDQALARTAVLGVQTNVEFLRFLLADERVRVGDLDTAVLDERSTVSVWGPPESAQVQVGDGEIDCASVQVTREQMSVTISGLRRDYRWAEADRHLWIADERGTWHLREAEEHKIHRAVGARPAEVVSPMPGSVIAVQVESGSQISAGDVVVVVEAMKMEHSLEAPVSGRVQVLVSVGDQVKVEQVLARIKD